jgi:epoxyqueuosine reductase
LTDKNVPRQQSRLLWQPRKIWVEKFQALGFRVAGVADFSCDDENVFGWDVQKWREWLAQQGHAQMHYMEKNEGSRLHPKRVLPEVQSALVLLAPYATGDRVRRSPRKNPISDDNQLPVPTLAGDIPLEKVIARYARGADYHKVLKKRLESLAKSFQTEDPSLLARAVVDTVPVFERAYAREAGLGFVGKNTMLIRPGLGSYFFISLLLVNKPAQAWCETRKPNALAELNCGSCRKCLDACPTQAFSKPYFLDAGKCLSYQTIENRDLIPSSFLSVMKDTLYGCDICQEVCPYNISTLDFLEIKELSEVRESLRVHTPWDLANMNLQQYDAWFGGSAMTRAKYGGLVRNALCFLSAHQDPRLPGLLKQREDDPNSLISDTCMQLLQILS